MASSSNGTVDFSKFNFPREIWYIQPPGEIAYKLLTLLPIVLFGIVSNLLLLNIIARNRALNTPTNLLLANMIAADTITLLFCPIVFIFNDFYQTFVLGPIGCKMDGFLQATFLITAVLNLCAVSYDRLTAIVLPMESRVTMRGAKIIIILTWLTGIAIATPIAIYRNYDERRWKNFIESFCVENMTILPIYWHVILLVLVLCPMTVMTICYSAIFWKLERYQKKVLKRENSISMSYKTKVARMLFIVVIIFVLLHIPFTALIFIRHKLLKNLAMDTLGRNFYILRYISHYCLFLNAALNPIIYGLTNDNFRRAYHQTPLLPNQIGRCLSAIKQYKYKKETTSSTIKKQRTDIHPNVYRLTLETRPDHSTVPSTSKPVEITTPIKRSIVK